MAMELPDQKAKELMRQGKCEEAIPFWQEFIKYAPTSEKYMGMINLSMCYTMVDLYAKAYAVHETVYMMSTTLFPLDKVTQSWLFYAEAFNCIALMEYGMARRFLEQCRNINVDPNLEKYIKLALDRVNNLFYHEAADRFERLYRDGTAMC